MVRFAVHLETCRVKEWSEHYVDFEKLLLMISDTSIAVEAIAEAWNQELTKISNHFVTLTREATSKLFHLSKTNDMAETLIGYLPGFSVKCDTAYFAARGALTSKESVDFENENSIVEASEIQHQIFPVFEQRQNFGIINVEALRKLAKRVKKHKCKTSGESLYLDLVSSMVANALTSDFLTHMKFTVSEALSHNTDMAHNPTHQSHHEGIVDKKLSEFEKLSKMIKTLDSSVSDKLVAHRGFHSRTDALNRPLENTVSAYEQAWAAGVRYCECDIALTLDNILVLCHDSELARLAHDRSKSNAFKPIHELTLEDLRNLPLKNGTLAPTLEDVLRVASRFPYAQLVIELKSGQQGESVGHALCDFFEKYQTLLDHVAVVMSFDMYILHSFSKYSLTRHWINSSHKKPKLMLLTVNKGCSNKPIELELDWESEDTPAYIRGLLTKEDIKLDGFYVEYSHHLLNPDSYAVEWMEAHKEHFVYGIWQNKNHPDDIDRATTLSKHGFSFINSDFPRHFGKPKSLD